MPMTTPLPSSGSTAWFDWAAQVDDNLRGNDGTVYVSPSGADANDGLSAATPVKSFAAAFARLSGGPQTVSVAAGVYTIDSESITQSVRVVCEPGVTFVRAAGADAAQGSYWSAGAAMFEVDAPGLTVEFSDFTYDGNSANQTSTEPTGFFLKTYPVASPTSAPTTVRITRGRFTNGTSGYLAFRGDDSQRRFETHAFVDDCTFTDTVYGVGKGDPATPNPLGYLPNYVLAYDYVTLVTRNFRAEWTKLLGTGQYAACALQGSYAGSGSATSGEPSIFMHGLTYIRGLGRAARKFDNDTEFVTNNGIGAIDCYGNADTLWIENLVAVDCQNVVARAKGSLKTFTVLAANLTDCHRGLQVSPSTTGVCETVVTVGSVNSQGGTIPQVEFIGSTTTDRLPKVSVSSVNIAGPTTNPEGLALEGAAHFRNIIDLDVSSLTVNGSPTRAATVIDVVDATIEGFRSTTSGTQGVFASYGAGGGMLDLSHFFISGCGADGVSIAGTPTRLAIRDGRVSGAVNYGVFSNNTCQDVTVENVYVEEMTGSSRGFYAGVGEATFIGNRTGANVTTPLVTHGTTRKREQHNSWNASEYRSFAVPTAGTWKVGDIVWRSNPTAGGHIGWVCTVAGTPGTWATFGAIA